MAVSKSKPTSPGRRHAVRVVNDDLHKGAPYRPLLESQSRNGGRNNNGRITTRHIGGGGDNARGPDDDHQVAGTGKFVGAFERRARQHLAKPDDIRAHVCAAVRTRWRPRFLIP